MNYAQLHKCWCCIDLVCSNVFMKMAGGEGRSPSSLQPALYCCSCPSGCLGYRLLLLLCPMARVTASAPECSDHEAVGWSEPLACAHRSVPTAPSWSHPGSPSERDNLEGPQEECEPVGSSGLSAGWKWEAVCNQLSATGSASE